MTGTKTGEFRTPGEPWPRPPEEMTPIGRVVRALLEPLRKYHDHRVVGLEHVPQQGPVMVATNHSLATYDGFMLAVAIYEHTGRVPVALADDLFFRLPLLREWAQALGMLPASPENGEQLLRDGRLLYLAPGGMREALRPREERYRVKWMHRKGFARLALRVGAPVVLAACPASDDLFTVYSNSLTDLAYDYFKVPLPVFRGVGPLPLPRRVPLVHYLGAPVTPPEYDPESEEQQVEAFHGLLVDRMADLMRQQDTWSTSSSTPQT